jgi:hypothetical protein
MGDRAVRMLRYAAAAGLFLLVAGCQAYRIGNPFLPQARLLAQSDDAQTTVTLDCASATSFKITTSPESMKFTLRPFPADITPGVRIDAYTVDWLDQYGNSASSEIPPRTQGLGLYLERGQGAAAGGGGAAGGAAGGGGQTAKSINISVVTNPVLEFGKKRGYQTGTCTARTDDWGQFLTGRVTFSGRDDNGHPLENLQAFFTLRYVTTASATGS